MHLPNQRLRKPDKIFHGAHSQTSYARVQWGNTLDKRGAAEPQRERGRERTGVKSGDQGEHRVTVKKPTRIYPCCRKLADRHNAQDMS